MKRPAFQFYPGDWLRDTALRSCSVGARGLWIDMLCLMHEGTPYGYLKVNHRVILGDNLARIIGATLEQTEGWLADLEAAGVFSRAPDGCIYSRRMVRDEEIRSTRAAGGIKGGNPALVSGEHATPKVNGKVRKKVNLTPNLPTTPASSSSTSSATEVELPFGSTEFKTAWSDWNSYRTERKLPAYVPRGAKAQLSRLREMGERAAIEAIRHSMAQNYQGIFPAQLPIPGLTESLQPRRVPENLQPGYTRE